jgi:hypothetical protein
MWDQLRATIPVGSVGRIGLLFYALLPLVGYLLGMRSDIYNNDKRAKKYGGRCFQPSLIREPKDRPNEELHRRD